jgi:hypothetical protein
MKNPAFSHARSRWSDLDSISVVILNIAQRPPASRLPHVASHRFWGLCALHSTRAVRTHSRQRQELARPQLEMRRMKNIQVIDGAENTAYDIFSATDEEFDLIFPVGQDVAFIDEVMARGPPEALDAAFDRIWKRRARKKDVVGIHGLLFYELEYKKRYYPSIPRSRWNIGDGKYPI